MTTPLTGAAIELRPPTDDDVPVLAAIRAAPEVLRWWRGGGDLAASVRSDVEDPEVQAYVISYDGGIVGYIQWGAEDDPDYRHANIDIYLDPAVHGRGLGADAIATLARHIFADHGHHRIVIDPAADNEAAIRCYGKVGFRPAGVMRAYERGADGSWHDGLLMDLLVDDLVGGV